MRTWAPAGPRQRLGAAACATGGGTVASATTSAGISLPDAAPSGAGWLQVQLVVKRRLPSDRAASRAAASWWQRQPPAAQAGQPERAQQAPPAQRQPRTGANPASASWSAGPSAIAIREIASQRRRARRGVGIRKRLYRLSPMPGRFQPIRRQAQKERANQTSVRTLMATTVRVS